MIDDYLWDGSGEPDPQVQKLETVLGRYRHNQPARAFDQIAEIGSVKHRWRFLNLRLSMQLGAVAACLVVSVTLYFYLRPLTVDGRGPSWARLSAGSASSSTATNPSAPRAPCVPRAQRSDRARRILKMPRLRSAKPCLDLTLA